MLEHAPGAANATSLRQLLFAAWQAGIQWYQGMLQGAQITPAQPLGETIPVPKALLQQVITILEATFDLPEEQQSPELLALIAQLKELVE